MVTTTEGKLHCGAPSEIEELEIRQLEDRTIPDAHSNVTIGITTWHAAGSLSRFPRPAGARRWKYRADRARRAEPPLGRLSARRDTVPAALPRPARFQDHPRRFRPLPLRLLQVVKRSE